MCCFAGMKKNENNENKYGHNIPYEFLIPRISFKMEQILSYFTQDIIDLILKKNAEIQQENIPGYPKLFHESL